MNRAFRVALFCGAFPLLVGILIFFLWLVTGWSWLEMAGFCTICAGPFIIVVGFIALYRFCGFASQTLTFSRRRLWLSTLGCAGLLSSNFLVAGCIILSVFGMETGYTVVVHNLSRQHLDHVQVSGVCGDNVSFGSIPPGGVDRRSFGVSGDGGLYFKADSGNTSYAETIDGYAMPGACTTVKINPDGTISANVIYGRSR